MMTFKALLATKPGKAISTGVIDVNEHDLMSGDVTIAVDYSTVNYKAGHQESNMKAFIVDRYGSADRVRASEVPDPEMREDDVLIEIHAAGVNPLDSKIRDGEFKLLLPYRLPLILGNELAGVVIRVGSRVRRFKPGDEVYARPDKNRIGTFAEFIAVSEDDLAIKPKSLTMEEAASIPMVGLTAWQALIEKAKLKKGQKVLIQAGSGGVGTFAIQLAKHVGAIVATTTSTANVELVKRLGADIVIDYKKDRFEEVLRDCDVVLNSPDGETLKKSLRVFKPGGKLISISGPPDPEFARYLGLSRILKLVMRLLSFRIRRQAKRHQVNYSFLFMRASGDQLRQISSLIETGAVRPVLDRVFPFESTNEALAYVETGRAKGKVVVRVR
jgi:NADPH:quinone reductase-like Zn-dependent oxidoreductase